LSGNHAVAPIRASVAISRERTVSGCSRSGTSPDLFIGQLRALRRDRRAYALI